MSGGSTRLDTSAANMIRMCRAKPIQVYEGVGIVSIADRASMFAARLLGSAV